MHIRLMTKTLLLLGVIGSIQAVSADQWISCAQENQQCIVPPTASLVRYGARNRFVFKQLIGVIDCNNGTFGDPIFGQVKSCEYLVADWNLCASENQVCNIPPNYAPARIPVEVRYGAGNSFAYQIVDNGILCSNQMFGDPIFGVVKSCWYKIQGGDRHHGGHGGGGGHGGDGGGFRGGGGRRR
jgi:alpha-L-rhamnosidase